MKKFIALLCALALILSALPALAESREKPEDKKVITTDDVIGAETVFKKYDNKFYDAPSTQPGTVVRLDYTTTAYGAEQPGWVNVYLPYGYDENRKCIRRCIRLFRHATPYRPPIGNGRRNRPDDPAPGRDGISTDSTHPPIPVGIVAGHLPQGGPYMPFFGPSGGLSPQEALDRRTSPPSALRGRLSGAGCIAREKEAIRRGLAA